MNDTPEVKGCIRLRFRNRGGQQMVVQRSVQLTQNKTTATFKALDGVIRTMDENKKKVSIGHKCGELDRHIPDLLGVSKAILENVIFCHQEDSVRRTNIVEPLHDHSPYPIFCSLFKKL